MKLKLLNSLLGVVALTVLACSPASAALIFADNFNTPVFPTATNIITFAGGTQLATTPVFSAGATFGWFAGANGVDWVHGSTGDLGADGDANGAWIDLNGLDSGSLEIAIVGGFTPGLNHTLVFFANTGVGGNQIDVEISNGYAVTGFTPTVLTTSSVTPAVSPLPLDQTGWQPFAVTFTPDVTNNIVVKFSSPTGGPVGAYLDDVLIISDDVVVPEPSTILLSGLGLVGLALYRRRSRA